MIKGLRAFAFVTAEEVTSCITYTASTAPRSDTKVLEPAMSVDVFELAMDGKG